MDRLPYDRAGEDIGNILCLEHVNVTVPDQGRATDFYVSALGLTRDPYLATGVNVMWINVGRSQFHLPAGPAQVLRGRTGLILPDLDALQVRFDRADLPYERESGRIDTACPWGNRIRVHGPQDGMALGMPYVEFEVPLGAAEGIAAFYREVWGVSAQYDGHGAARVPAGPGQDLRFLESDAPAAEFDGHHIAIYVGNFSGPYNWLLDRGLVTEESNRWQYRFVDIVDPGSGDSLFRVEHEVRSMTHPIFGRELVNRNPMVTTSQFASGHERIAWTTF